MDEAKHTLVPVEGYPETYRMSDEAQTTWITVADPAGERPSIDICIMQTTAGVQIETWPSPAPPQEKYILTTTTVTFQRAAAIMKRYERDTR
jgi:hypothetical protein